MSRNALVVASPGGHLDELHALTTRFVPADHEMIWITSETAQSRSLLVGEAVEWVTGVGPRQGLRAAKSLPGARRLMRRYNPRLVVSTGAALSVPYLIAARLHGVETHFIDSATRRSGPSLTGRVAQQVPGIQLHCQGPWAGGRWEGTDDVFNSFKVEDRTAVPVRRVLVSLGSERFSFSRAVRVVAHSLPPDVEVVWQLGHTPTPPMLPGVVHQWLPFDEMRDMAQEADVVITHCGVGSVLMALRAGKRPLVFPRQKEFQEHVDDHQKELAEALAATRMALVAGPDLADVGALISVASTQGVVPRSPTTAK